MSKRYAIITGGQLFNKGAEAMTFTIVDELKRSYPDKEIIMFSTMDFGRKEDKAKYTFKILPSPRFSELLFLSGGIHKFFSIFKKKDYKYLNELKRVLEDTDLLIDISGYSLGSNWGFYKSISYAYRFKMAENFNIKAIIMPQSFGPFEYKGIHRIIMTYVLRNYMKYPQKIYTREKEGFESLKNYYNLKNVYKSPDMVLLKKSIDFENIYKCNNPIREFNEVSENSVAIVPNMKNFKYGNKSQIIELYTNIINKLLSYNRKVYIIRHSFEDIEACKAIKENFEANNDVVIMRDDISSFEYHEIIKKFDFIIASRYHSIVHAYKNCIPCIALGWAVKYHELLEMFNQEEYIFDVRTKIDFNQFEIAITKMHENYELECRKICETLQQVQTQEIIDLIQ